MSWQTALQSGFKSPEDLLSYLELDVRFGSQKAHDDFDTRVPLSYAARMKKGDKNCPLLKQVLPLESECEEQPGFFLDPLQEKSKNPMQGVLHKYHGRVLVMLAISCAVNCRYCFRRHFPYDDNQMGSKNWETLFKYLSEHPEVHEVILSGGDPLMLTNPHLERFIRALERITTIKTLRFHTRLPVVIPERIDEGLIKILGETRFNKVMVYHINHANELCDEIKCGVRALQNIGVTMLNQSVLLKDVNDTPDSLIALSHGLFESGLLPYYLHLLDKVKGASHFEVCDKKGVVLHQAMLQALPGYLVPKLVMEKASVTHKVILQ